MGQRQTILDLARRQVGIQEQPAGSNRVKYNTAYYGGVVSGQQFPWCCVFLWWLFQTAGLSRLFYGGKKTASCGTLATYGKENHQFVSSSYQPGDLVFFRFSGKNIQHVGLLEKVDADGALTTIEGNTGTANNANGGAVLRRIRTSDCVVGAYRPQYADVAQEQFDARMDDWLRRKATEFPGAWSADARCWAEQYGILQGGTDGTKQYKSFCTREQVVVFLYRLFCQEIAKMRRL